MTHLWIPRTRIIEPRDPLMLRGGRMSGHFRICGKRPDGRERVIAGWQPNLITDAGLERYGSTTGATTWCSLGSGTATPQVSDTGLVAPFASAAMAALAGGVQSSEPYYGWQQRQAAFTPPGTPLTVAEIGFGWESDGSTLWSRALIKDEEGDPQSFIWLADESLAVTYELRLYPWLADATDAIVLGGIEYETTTRAAKVTWITGWRAHASGPAQLFMRPTNVAEAAKVYGGNIGAITTIPSGTATEADSAVESSYVAESLKRSGSCTWNQGSANYKNGIGALYVVSTAGSYQVDFDPKLPKTASVMLTLNVDSPSWGRAS